MGPSPCNGASTGQLPPPSTGSQHNQRAPRGDFCARVWRRSALALGGGDTANPTGQPTPLLCDVKPIRPGSDPAHCPKRPWPLGLTPKSLIGSRERWMSRLEPRKQPRPRPPAGCLPKSCMVVRTTHRRMKNAQVRSKHSRIQDACKDPNPTSHTHVQPARGHTHAHACARPRRGEMTLGWAHGGCSCRQHCTRPAGAVQG